MRNPFYRVISDTSRYACGMKPPWWMGVCYPRIGDYLCYMILPLNKVYMAWTAFYWWLQRPIWHRHAHDWEMARRQGHEEARPRIERLEKEKDDLRNEVKQAYHNGWEAYREAILDSWNKDLPSIARKNPT